VTAFLTGCRVAPLPPALAMRTVVAKHYLHRRCNCWSAFGLFDQTGELRGVCVFGIPASREMQTGACPSKPEAVIELNRLWVDDVMPRNSESWFVRRCLAALPARVVLSYADTSVGHQGYVYRAAGFRYAGWTDMDRVTPRFDYVPAARTAETLFGPVETRAHSRDAFRSGSRAEGVTTVRRKPKVRYWEVTGNRRERRDLARLVAWPSLSWKDQPPPSESRQ
jgi:hypothetical protein